MDADALNFRLNCFPKLVYGVYPTPLQRLARLEKRVHGPTLWLKRDDGLGPAMGGNKGRKLEFLMADALNQGYRKVITFGGLQSNHARMTAAACAPLGLQPHLFFFAPRPPVLTGNLLFDQLLGAKLHFIPFGGQSSGDLTLEQTTRLVRWLARLLVGPGGYFMPVGGHTPLGCLGYVAAALELHQQAQTMGLPLDKTTIVTAAGTGGTLTGLLVGLSLLNSPLRLLGLDIGKLWRAFPDSLARLAGQICQLLGEYMVWRGRDIPLIQHRYAGPGYSQLDDPTRQAISLLAQQEGILLDPVYTGKAFAGMLDLIQQRYFTPAEHLIFLHTGGLPGLWAFPELVQ
ncbi:MAG: pyridoxal-phosphate dependent enzyme [Anaerolineae bacterium]|nr:pyridoxal-phosphate dependent enzyme [Anaerolineae bacterium]